MKFYSMGIKVSGFVKAFFFSCSLLPKLRSLENKEGLLLCLL